MKRAPVLAAVIALSAGVLGAMAATATSSVSPALANFGAPIGGFAAYHAVAVMTNPTATTPANRLVRYTGPKLVLAQTYLGRKAAEPTLGVDKSGAIFTVAAAFDAVPGSPPKNEPKTLVMRSLDGGRTFEVAQPVVAGQNTHPVSTDPYIYVDPDLGRVFDIDLQGVNGANLSYSDDKGKTYTTVVLSSAFGANDHQTLVTGVAPQGAPLAPIDPKFPKIVYYCVNQIAVGGCARSIDGGRTWLQGNQTGYEAVRPTDLVGLNNDRNDGICGSLHGHAITDRQGRLFIPRGYCQRPYIAISNDEGTTFNDVAISDTVGQDGEQASVAADAAGNLYYVWQDNIHELPYLSTSRDHGLHWSTPLMIAPPGVHEVNFPTIDVGDVGKVAITFPGTTFVNKAHPNQPSTDRTRPWNSYVVVSTDALSAHPLFLSNIANPPYDPVARGDCKGRCGRMYDFLDIVSAPADQGRIFAMAVDTCTDYLGCRSHDVPGNWDSNDVVQEETAHDYGASADMQGVLIREVSGPALRGHAPYITRDTRR